MSELHWRIESYCVTCTSPIFVGYPEIPDDLDHRGNILIVKGQNPPAVRRSCDCNDRRWQSADKLSVPWSFGDPLPSVAR